MPEAAARTVDRKMRAAVLHGREDLRVEQVAVPVAGPGELVLRVHAALTCGTDLKVYRRGYHAKMLTEGGLFGHELAGTVEQVGDGVTGFALGDRVVPLNSAPCDVCFFCRNDQQNLCEDLLFNNGAYAEYIRIPARIVEKNTLRLPDEMPFEYAALTEPLACVVRGLEESQARAGQTMIVLGAGPIGLLFIHTAALLGLKVIAVVKRLDQVATAKKFGAAEVVRVADVDDPIAAARALTPEGRGADIVIEAVASPEAWQWAVQMARKGGLVNLFGGPPAGTTVALDTNLIHYSDLTLKASFHHTPGTARHAFDLLASGRFRCREFLTGETTLEDLPEVFCEMLTRPSDKTAPEIKTVIWPQRGLRSELEDAARGARVSTVTDLTRGIMDDRLQGAPEIYRTPEFRPSLAQAREWCKTLATKHYENFHVATFFLPAGLRPHFHSVYAFCRTSDDLGDEVADVSTAMRLLGEWRAMFRQCFANPELSRHPVFVALQPTIAERALTMQPFDDLISAFEQDQVYTHHESLKTLEEYSRYSANPVGRLVLLVCGYRSEELMQLSDEICTGLQLANFYQDVVEDRDRGRRYLPAEVMQRFGVTDEQLIARQFDPNVRAMMEFLVADARARLARGERITQLVQRDLACTLRLFVRGGYAILDAIAKQGYDTLRARPVVTKAAKLRLLGGAMAGKLRSVLLPGRSAAGRGIIA